MAVRQPTPNRWRGPLGTTNNSLSEEDEKEHWEKMAEQIMADATAIEDTLLWEAPNFIGNFLGAEEESRGEFANKHGWSVAAAIPLLQILEKLLKEIPEKMFLDETTKSFTDELEIERELLEAF